MSMSPICTESYFVNYSYFLSVQILVRSMNFFYQLPKLYYIMYKLKIQNSVLDWTLAYIHNELDRRFTFGTRNLQFSLFCVIGQILIIIFSFCRTLQMFQDMIPLQTVTIGKTELTQNSLWQCLTATNQQLQLQLIITAW